MKESTIQANLIKYLRLIDPNVYVVKAGLNHRQGIPDLLICLKGLFVAIEVKKPGEKPTELQEYNLRKITEAGGLSFSCNNLDDFRRKLDEIIRKIK